jgi:hypothetical protein
MQIRKAEKQKKKRGRKELGEGICCDVWDIGGREREVGASLR